MKKTRLVALGLGALSLAGLVGAGVGLSVNNNVRADEVKADSTISSSATRLNIVDNTGWLFNALHLYSPSFDTYSDGVWNYTYTATDFETYLTSVYGAQDNGAYTYRQSTDRRWGKGDDGTYFINDGSSSGSHTYLFPSWVNGFTFQMCNSDNWIPGEGHGFHSSWGYHWDNSFTLDLNNKSPVLSANSYTESYTYDWNTVSISKEVRNKNGQKIEDLESESIICADKYFPESPNSVGRIFSGWYTDSALTEEYSPSFYSAPAKLYAKCVVTPESLSTYIMSQESGDIATANCAVKYEKATQLYNELTSDEKTSFETTYTDAHARYQKWIEANANPSSAKTVTNNGFDNNVVVIAGIGVTTLLAGSVALFIRRKKLS